MPRSLLAPRFVVFCCLVAALVFPIDATQLKYENRRLSPVVGTKFGDIVGLAYEMDGVQVYSYRGIPFAKPPVGDLRFERLQPLDRPWHKTLDATAYQHACMSNTSETMSPQKDTSEDCMYINVFTSKRCLKNKNCPVIFMVHGGGFYYDSAVMWDDQYILQKYVTKDVVFVLPAYRLGVFGFLSWDEIGLESSLGMFDLLDSLRWTQREVRAFGGDPRDVTLFGNSAGSAAIVVLSLSPHVPLLWNKAYVSSIGIHADKINHEIATKAIFDHFNCTSGSPHENIQCMKKVPAKDIIDYHSAIEDAAHLKLNGPHSYSGFLGHRSLKELLPTYKAVPTVLSSMFREFDQEDWEVINTCSCFVQLNDLNAPGTNETCIRHYTNNRFEDGALKSGTEPYRSYDLDIANAITRLGEPVYMLLFGVPGHNTHSKDMTYLVNTHPIAPENRTAADDFSYAFLPTKLLAFVKSGAPDPDWPVFRDGSNYQFVSENGSHAVLQPFLPQEAHYWQVELPELDRRNRRWNEFSEKWKWAQYTIQYYKNQVEDFITVLKKTRAIEETDRLADNLLAVVAEHLGVDVDENDLLKLRQKIFRAVNETVYAESLPVEEVEQRLKKALSGLFHENKGSSILRFNAVSFLAAAPFNDTDFAPETPSCRPCADIVPVPVPVPVPVHVVASHWDTWPPFFLIMIVIGIAIVFYSCRDWTTREPSSRYYYEAIPSYYKLPGV